MLHSSLDALQGDREIAMAGFGPASEVDCRVCHRRSVACEYLAPLVRCERLFSLRFEGSIPKGLIF
jgi:hypothetical protein